MGFAFPLSRSKDHFVVRWDYKEDNENPGFLSLKAGTIVQLIEFHKLLAEAGKGKTHHVAYVKVVRSIRRRKGYVRIAFLQPLFAYGFPVTEAGILYQRCYGIDDRLWKCQWYMASANPVYVAIRLRNDASAPFGSFVVVSQTELNSKRKQHWKCMSLLVKRFSGSLESFIQDTKRNQFHSEFFNATRATAKDRKPIPDSADNGIAYIPIQRTRTGKFYLRQCDHNVFSTIFALISFYMGRRLPVNSGPHLTLTQPFQILDVPVRGPPPHCNKKLGVEYHQPADCSGLLVQNHIHHRSYIRSFEIDKENELETGKTFYGIVRESNGNADTAAIKLLNKFWFDESSFSADLQKLVLSDRRNNEALKQNNRDIYYTHGIDYLAKIVGYSDPQKAEVPFVAYEFFPNLSLLDSLRYGRQYSTRGIYEILYQVAAGMYHLEINGLCHRSLCASNVIIHWDDELSASVKITDYFLPSHHLVSQKLKGSDSEKAQMKALRWQWMSPESLFQGVFDIISDTWSFGCLIFELYNQGMPPYSHEKSEISSPESLKQFLIRKKKMKLCANYTGPEELLKIFQSCFESRPERASFFRLIKLLNQLLFDDLAKGLKENKAFK